MSDSARQVLAEADLQRAYRAIDEIRDQVAAGRLEPAPGELPDDVDRAAYRVLDEIANLADTLGVKPY